MYICYRYQTMNKRNTMYNQESKIFKLAAFLSFIWFLFVLAIIGSVFYLVYTIITKPELLANWIKVVFG